MNYLQVQINKVRIAYAKANPNLNWEDFVLCLPGCDINNYFMLKSLKTIGHDVFTANSHEPNRSIGTRFNSARELVTYFKEEVEFVHALLPLKKVIFSEVQIVNNKVYFEAKTHGLLLNQGVNTYAEEGVEEGLMCINMREFRTSNDLLHDMFGEVLRQMKDEWSNDLLKGV